MANVDLRETAFNRLRPDDPLDANDPQGYYVPRPRRLGVEMLVRWLETDRTMYSKFLLTGQRGSGKSTELNRLAKVLSAGYFVISYSIEDVHDLLDISKIDVLVSLASQLIAAAKEDHLDADILEQFLSWSCTAVQEWQDDVRGLTTAGAKLNWLVSLGRTIEKGSTYRELVRRQVEPRLTDLLELLNSMISMVERSSGTKLLFIVDGIDKVGHSDLCRLFVDSSALLLPKAKIIYTVPYEFIMTDAFAQIRTAFAYSSPFTLPAIPIRHRDGSPNVVGRAFLTQVLLRRSQVGVFTDDSVSILVELSGGVVRNLIGLAKEACLHSLMRTEEDPTSQPLVLPEDVKHATINQQAAFQRTLSAEEILELGKIRGDPSKSMASSAIREALIHKQAVIVYADDSGREWCDVNPLISEPPVGNA